MHDLFPICPSHRFLENVPIKKKKKRQGVCLRLSLIDGLFIYFLSRLIDNLVLINI